MIRRAATIAAGLLVAAPAVAVAAPAAPATPLAGSGCRVAYAVTGAWAGGYVGTAAVTNAGAALPAWTLSVALPSGAPAQIWGTTSAAALPTGTTAQVGLTALGAPDGVPTFQLDGVVCTTVRAAPTAKATKKCKTGKNGKKTCKTVTKKTKTKKPTSTTTKASTTSTTTTSTKTTTSTTSTTSTPPTQPPGWAPALKVSGNKLVTSAGLPYRLLGVNRSGGEFACIQGYQMWNGPMDQASIDAMRAWKIRAVRVPLNEECWLATASVPAGGTKGADYQAEVKKYVDLLIRSGITPIVEMHWNYGLYTGPSSGCSKTEAACQKPMPDAQYAPTFWTQVAGAFKGNDAVVFDLFNEPYPERATGDTTSGWKCWRDGGTCNGISYQVAGFQTLVNAVRATGATNVIMVGGLAYSNDASQMLTYLPNDPIKNIMGFGHVYNFNTCSTTGCYDSTFAQVAKQIPFALTEIGENDCGHGFIDTIMNWADTNGISYLGWTWNNWDCSTGPSLITDWSGTPTAFGIGLKTHFATVSN